MDLITIGSIFLFICDFRLISFLISVYGLYINDIYLSRMLVCFYGSVILFGFHGTLYNIATILVYCYFVNNNYLKKLFDKYKTTSAPDTLNIIIETNDVVENKISDTSSVSSVTSMSSTSEQENKVVLRKRGRPKKN